MSVSQKACQNDLAKHRERTILKPFNELAFLSTALAKLTMPVYLADQGALTLPLAFSLYFLERETSW
jgi:hypothetical protein